MRIEVEYSECGITSSVLKWISVGVALHMALHALIFCEDETVSNFLSIFALLMAAGWTTEETRALVSVPLPIRRAGLAHSYFGSMRIAAANVDAFNTHWPAVNLQQAQYALNCIQCRQAFTLLGASYWICCWWYGPEPKPKIFLRTERPPQPRIMVN